MKLGHDYNDTKQKMMILTRRKTKKQKSSRVGFFCNYNVSEKAVIVTKSGVSWLPVGCLLVAVVTQLPKTIINSATAGVRYHEFD